MPLLNCTLSVICIMKKYYLFSKTNFFPKKRFISKDHNTKFAFSCVNSSLHPGNPNMHL